MALLVQVKNANINFFLSVVLQKKNCHLLLPKFLARLSHTEGKQLSAISHTVGTCKQEKRRTRCYGKWNSKKYLLHLLDVWLIKTFLRAWNWIHFPKMYRMNILFCNYWCINSAFLESRRRQKTGGKEKRLEWEYFFVLSLPLISHTVHTDRQTTVGGGREGGVVMGAISIFYELEH